MPEARIKLTWGFLVQCSIILFDCNHIWNSSSDFQVSRQFDKWKPYCCMWVMFPSFHTLKENMFKLVPNFLSPVTLSGKFSHTSAGYQLDVHACVSQPFLCIVDSLPWNAFPLFGVFIKHSLYYRSDTYLVRWFWKCSVSVCWDALDVFPCWGKRQFYEGTYSRWKGIAKEMELLASQWVTGSKTR